MRKKLGFAVIAALVLFSTNAFADEVVGIGGWQTWSTAVLNENGNPYWDGNSSDSTLPYTIGNYLTNTGGFSGNTVPGNIPYWGTASGGSDPFSLHWISGSSNAAIRLEVSNFASGNIFGYVDGTGLHPLFSGSASAGATATFTPTGDYKFYLTSPEGTFNTAMSGDNSTYQHFAIFKESAGAYWLGMEDLVNAGSSDKDYNDMIVRVSQVPEPATMLLFGFGLVGLFGVSRRRTK